MLPSEELLQSIDIIAKNAAKNGVKIYTAIVTAVADNNTCSVRVNGKTHSNIAYYGDAPTVNKSYRVFCPNGSMNQAFIITGGGSSSGGGSTGTTDYNQLTNRPSINGTTLSGNQLSSQLGLYGTNNAPPYPVQSVNTKTGAVVLTQDDIGDGTTYVRTHNDFTDVLKTQINTNEDNIAMAESDIDGLQTDVGTLKTNVTSLQTALTSKQDVIVGAASTITEDNLAADRALISNSSGKVEVSNITSTELGYLDGVTSNVQTQLDKKLEKAPVTSVNSKTGAVQLNATDVGALPDTTVIPSKTSQLDNDSRFISELPIASSAQLGGVKVGTGLSVTADGTLSATGGGTADAVEWNNVLDKPTTIAGYGITDAKIENDTITLGANSIKPYGATNPPPYPVTSVNGQTGDVTVDVDLPEHLVKYQPLTPVEATTLVNADTLQGHDATYFAKQSDVNTINSQVSTNTSDISTLQSGLSTVNANIANKLDKSGGTMTGPLVAKSGINLTIAQVRNIIISTEEPSAEVGSNGDIWIRYTE